MNTPDGYRFLIQLVDAKTAAEAMNEVQAVFGKEIGKKCVLIPGCERHIKPPKYGWIRSASGFTAFIPKEMRI